MPIPDLSYRIVRIAENHHTCLRIRQFCFQFAKVNRIFPVFISQRTFQNVSPIIHNRIEENIVYRRQKHDFLSHSRHFSDYAGNGRHNTGTKDHPLFLHMKVMTHLPPVLNCTVPFFRHDSVTEHSMSGTFLNRLLNLRSRLKIHIGNPHGKFICRHIPL